MPGSWGSVAFVALTMYMVPGTKFADAAADTHQAAVDLFGAGSPERLSVADAWCAVGVGC